jgi:TolB-like protein
VNGPVFLSYASQDADAAWRIRESLRAAGIAVWCDQSELRGGDAWDAKIRKQIKECSLFVPVISANTQARGEGYFRFEWKLAVERSHHMGEHVPFLVPVTIDGTSEKGAHVPGEFLRPQWSRLPGGEVPPGFVEQLRRLLTASETVAGADDPGAGQASPRSTSSGQARPATARATPSRRFIIYPALIGAFAVLIASVAWFTRSAAPSGPSASGPAKDEVASGVTVDDKSIAVLPFANRSEDKEKSAVFSDGVHDDVLTSLFNIKELRVVSRTSVEQYRDSKKPVPQIARELGVAYILEGSVQRVGDQVHVTGQLIRAARDEHLWAKSYDRALTAANIFAIQAELAQAIAEGLKAAISPAEKVRVERRPTENLAALDAFNEWRKEYNTFALSNSSLGRQVEMLNRAVSLDPNFADAWAALAFVHSRFVFASQGPAGDHLSRAQESIGNATRIAPDSPAVILYIGVFHAYTTRDLVRAEAQFQKLIQLQPNNSEAHAWLGVARGWQGRFAESLASYRRAAQVDPTDLQNQAGVVSLLEDARRYTEARVELSGLITRRSVAGFYADNPEQLLTDRSRLAQISYAERGSTKEMEAFFSSLTTEQQGSVSGQNRRINWASLSGDFREGVRLFEFLPVTADPNVAPGLRETRYATLRLALGDQEGARALLEAVLEPMRTRVSSLPERGGPLRSLSLVEALLGKSEEAVRDATEATRLVPESRDHVNGATASYNLALVHAWTGDKERALAELARLLQVPHGAPSVHVLRTSAETFPLHGDPRFEALLNDPKNNAPLF